MRCLYHLRARSLALALVGVLLTASAAFAQAAGPTSERQALAELVGTIEDPVRRETLLEQLRALLQVTDPAPQDASASPLSERLVEAAKGAGSAVREGVETVVVQVADAPVLLDWMQRLATDPEWRRAGGRLAAQLLGIVVTALLAELIARRALARPLAAIARRKPLRLTAKLYLIGARAGLEALPIGAFAITAVAAAAALDPPLLVRRVALQLVTAYVLSRIVLLLGRRILAPQTPRLRLVPLSDRTADQVIGSLRIFVNTAVGGLLLIEIARLLGLPAGGYVALQRALGALLLLMWTIYILRHRAAVASWLRERRLPLSRHSPTLQASLAAVAASWHVVAIAYAVGFFVISAFAIEDGFELMARGTAGTVLAVVLAWWALGRLRRLRRGREQPSAWQSPPATSRAERYAALAVALAQAAVVAIAVMAVLIAWGFDLRAMLASAAAERVGGFMLTAAVVIGMSTITWEIADTAIERYLRGVTGDGIRARTLLPLLRKALLVVLTVVVLLTLLSELGIQIAPLLAGAGVVGLAIGFGAQRLVQDVITGFFILVEDSIAVGDVVSVAGMSGVVEDLSIRSIRLRDIAGTVHTIPFSSVGTVSNMTRGFAYFVADIGVGYGEDVDRVAEVCTAIVEEMRADDRYRYDILEPLEVLGLDRFADSAVVIKARIKTRPIKQWAVGREFNRRMKKRFDELGIEIPFPQRAVHFAGSAVARRPTAAEAVAALGA